VARAVRERDTAVFIAALSGWGQEEDRERSREAGFDVHMVKPVAPEDLSALLARVAARRRDP
jgi:DNA-binding response OmpR family regulator